MSIFVLYWVDNSWMYFAVITVALPPKHRAKVHV